MKDTTLKKIAREEKENLEKNSKNEWPDCYEVSNRIQTVLEERGIDSENVKITEFVIPPEYRHYAIVLSKEILGVSAVVDASFSQFSSESDTPISIAPKEDIDEVIIAQPKQSYIFYAYMNST